MERLKLVLPRVDHKSQVMDYKREFIENKDRLYGSGGLKNAKNFNEWYISVCNNKRRETLRQGLSTQTTYLAIRIEDAYLIGFITIRHHLNDFLIKSGGHIDYSVRKSQRNKGYASEMLGLGLKKCKELEMKNILITCEKNNIASLKTIIKNGGKLENEIKEKDKISQNYWISLD